jgi:hypothetical protein
MEELVGETRTSTTAIFPVLERLSIRYRVNTAAPIPTPAGTCTPARRGRRLLKPWAACSTCFLQHPRSQRRGRSATTNSGCSNACVIELNCSYGFSTARKTSWRWARCLVVVPSEKSRKSASPCGSAFPSPRVQLVLLKPAGMQLSAVWLMVLLGLRNEQT